MTYTKTKVELPKDTDMPEGGTLFYNPKNDLVFRLTCITGTWHTPCVAAPGGHRFGKGSSKEATEGLIPCPPGTVITITVERG